LQPLRNAREGDALSTAEQGSGPSTAKPLLILVELGFRDDAAEQEFKTVLPRMESELAGIVGCLERRTFIGAGRRYLFFTVWQDEAALERWVNNEFHRTILMPGFRRWCDEAWFGYWSMLKDNDRVRRCPACGRWTPEQPGWSSKGPAKCGRCGAELSSGKQ
jgi:heme-degrading monooxygenase HmoA